MEKDRLSMNLSQIRSKIDLTGRHSDDLITYELQLKAKIATQMNIVQKGETRINQIVQVNLTRSFMNMSRFLALCLFTYGAYSKLSRQRAFQVYI